ncbi:MAG: methylisocitrate lyase [Nitrospirota bacterium]|nr:methylisocitrate lyase [Nitrospirota bacterium]
MEKTTRMRHLIEGPGIVMPGAFNAATALLAEKAGFEAVYISGAGLSNGAAGLPDAGLLALPEMVELAAYIAQSVKVPVVADADTGFGGPENAARTVKLFEQAGVAGIHIEDQTWPKRCGHLTGKTVISTEEMVEKVKAAVEARKSGNFIVIARTDARSVNGFDDAVMRANAFIDAGADMIFPEALENRDEFAEFARQVKAPLMANMTEFGRTAYLPADEFFAMGYRVVIFPMTAFRVAMKAVEDTYRELREKGTQKRLLDRMQTRQELYDLLGYKP